MSTSTEANKADNALHQRSMAGKLNCVQHIHIAVELFKLPICVPAMTLNTLLAYIRMEMDKTSYTYAYPLLMNYDRRPLPAAK